VTNNYVCGNFSMSDGGGIAHVGVSSGTNLITSNKILLNQTFNQSADPTGGGLFIGGQIPVGGGASAGTGDVTVDRNVIQYNHADAGAGGGVSIARTTNNDTVLLTNNMVTNNVSAYAGGGVAVASATAEVHVVNNTVAKNVSTATNRQSFPNGPKVQSLPQVAGIARLSGTGPTLFNNIVWGNESYTWSINRSGAIETTSLAFSKTWDLGIVDSTNALPSSNSVLSLGATLTSCTTCVQADATSVGFVRAIEQVSQTDTDQPVVLPESTVMQTALTFDEGGNFINVNFSPLTPWDLADASKLRSDYHILDTSVALNAGVARTSNNRVPSVDFDGQPRPSVGVSSGADQVLPPVPTVSGISPNEGLRPASGTANYAVTLTGTNLIGAALSENANGFILSNVVVVNAAQITATVQVNADASAGAKTITVATAGGSATATFTIVLPPAPTLTSITPNTGVRPATGTANYPVTLTGTNLSAATLTVGSNNINLANVVVSANQITATVQVGSGASLGSKTLTVTSGGGTATVTFLVVSATPVAFTGDQGTGGLNGSRTTLNFGDRTGVQTNTLTLTVGGTVPVVFGAASIANVAPAAYSLVTGFDTCSSTTKNPGDTCTIRVAFNAPAGTNTRTGTLTVPYTGAAAGSALLGLTGQ
jgi:hypothetical protein